MPLMASATSKTEATTSSTTVRISDELAQAVRVVAATSSRRQRMVVEEALLVRPEIQLALKQLRTVARAAAK